MSPVGLFLHPCTLAHTCIHRDRQAAGRSDEGRKPLLTWQPGEVMAAVTIADRRRGVISAVFSAVVVRGIPGLQLHHRSHIPSPTSSLLKTQQAAERDEKVRTTRSHTHTAAASSGGVITQSPDAHTENTESQRTDTSMCVFYFKSPHRCCHLGGVLF